MNTKLTYSIKNNSESYKHVLNVLEEYGKKATFRVGGVRYLIKDAKPQGKNSTLLFLEL